MRSQGSGGEAAAELVAQGQTVTRVSNETIQAIAVQKPRDEKKVLEKVLAELDLAPELAGENYYSIPYRDRTKGDDGVWRTRITLVEGPSIWASMAIARRWGNCTAASHITEQDDRSIQLEGIFCDLETNTWISRPIEVPKVYQKGSGKNVQWIPMNPKRLEMGVAAAASKAIRNAIVYGVPKFITHKYTVKAKTLAAGCALDKTAPKERVEAVVNAFARYQVTPEMLETYIWKKRPAWLGDDLGKLIGLGNAIRDEVVDVKEVWPEQQQQGVSMPKEKKANGQTPKPEAAPPPANETPRTNPTLTACEHGVPEGQPCGECQTQPASNQPTPEPTRSEDPEPADDQAGLFGGKGPSEPEPEEEESAADDGGGGHVMELDAAIKTVVGPAQSEGKPPTWTISFETADSGASGEAITEVLFIAQQAKAFRNTVASIEVEFLAGGVAVLRKIAASQG